MGKRGVFKVSVQALIYNNSNEIVLLKRSSNLDYGNMYSLPGGHLENNESITSGIIRELKEEIGVTFDEDELELIKVINRKISKENYIDFIFKGSLNNRKVTNLEKDKCSRIIYREYIQNACDSIDVGLCQVNPDFSCKLIDGLNYNYPIEIKEKLFKILLKGADLEEVCKMNFVLGHCFAHAANLMIKKHNIKPDFISSHGQNNISLSKKYKNK